MWIENKLDILIPFQYISGDGQSYVTQDRQTVSSAMTPQSSQGKTASVFTCTVYYCCLSLPGHASCLLTGQVKVYFMNP